MLTKVDKSVQVSYDFMPFGEEASGNTSTTHKFTGKERDSESSLDYFGARYLHCLVVTATYGEGF